MMEEARYKMTQDQLVMLANLIDGLDLEGFLAAISHAHTVAPMVDPTLWIAGHKKMENVKRLAIAFRGVQVEVRRQKEA